MELLRGWNFRLHDHSSATTLFELWFGDELRRHVLDRIVSREARERILTGDENGDSRPLLDILLRPDGRLGDSPEGTRDALLLASLRESLARISGLLGEEAGTWRWGRVHRTSPSHPLSPLAGDGSRKILDLPSFPRGGGKDTVGNTDYDRGAFRQKTGASWRMVVDVGAWDESLAMNSPGQSGDPASRH